MNMEKWKRRIEAINTPLEDDWVVKGLIAARIIVDAEERARVRPVPDRMRKAIRGLYTPSEACEVYSIW